MKRAIPFLLLLFLAAPGGIALAHRPHERAGPSDAVPAGVGRFSSSLFRFVSIIPDDGRDRGGGWQEASAVLKFVDGRHLIPAVWSCRVTVGMPFRTGAWGPITPEYAAEISATLATDASTIVMQRRAEWLPALYCAEFIAEMRSMFRDRYDGLGARVK